MPVLLLGALLFSGLVYLLIKVVIPRSPISQTKTLTYWGLFEPDSVYLQAIADFEKDHPKVKVQYNYSTLKEYRERLQNALSSGSGPDIFRIHQSWVPMLGKYLSPVPPNVYDTASFEEIFYPSAKDSLKYQGQYIAIPLEFDGLGLYYNEGLFKSAGKTPPKNWIELRETAGALTTRDQQGKIQIAGVALGAVNVDHWSDILGMMMLQNGADLSNPAACSQGGAIGEKICPGADALSFFTLFTKTDRVWDETMPSSTYAFSTGKLAMYFGPSWRVFDIENFKKEYKTNLDYKIIPVPQLQDGNLNWASYWVEAVSKTSPNQALAWEFLKYLSSRETMQKLYQTESSLRLFGEPYSRVDLAENLRSQPYVGAYIQQAPTAKNWYLSSETKDNGINDQIIKYYEDAVNAVNDGEEPLGVLTTTGQGVMQVLRQYGLSK